MPVRNNQDSLDTLPEDATGCSADEARAPSIEPVTLQRPKTRTKRPRPTFEDGSLTRVFKFPSKTYPRSSYYVTGTEIIIRIRKFRKRWKLVIPKKRVVTYRTNRWFAKPRWIELELTFTQANRLGLVGPSRINDPGLASAKTVSSEVHQDETPTEASDFEASADDETSDGAQATLQLDTDGPDAAASDSDETDDEATSLALTQTEGDWDADTGSPHPPLEHDPATDTIPAAPTSTQETPAVDEASNERACAETGTETETRPAAVAAGEPARPEVWFVEQTKRKSEPPRLPRMPELLSSCDFAMPHPASFVPVSDELYEPARDGQETVCCSEPPTHDARTVPIEIPAPPPEVIAAAETAAPAPAEEPLTGTPPATHRAQRARRSPALLLAACMLGLAGVAVHHLLPGSPAPLEHADTAERGLLRDVAAAGEQGVHATAAITTGSIDKPSPARAFAPIVPETAHVTTPAPEQSTMLAAEKSTEPVSEAPVAEDPVAQETVAGEPVAVALPDLAQRREPADSTERTANETPAAISAPAPSVADSRATAEAIPCRSLIEAAGSIRIEFDYASARLDAEPRAALLQVADLLHACPAAMLIVEGHTDSDGDPDRNQMVSVRRSQAVRDVLVSTGAEPRRLSVVGFGNSRPLLANDTPDNKRRNRRVVLIVDLSP